MNPIYATMPMGDYYGWAICGNNLMKEMSKKTEVRYVPYDLYDGIARDYDTDKFVKKITAVPNGKGYNYLQAIENNNPKPKYKGIKNVGYMFYEEETMSDEMIEDLKGYDVIVTGSEWNSEIVRNYGFDNAITIHQGVDCDIFRPEKSTFFGDKFMIFSGGKLEPRKAQDIVSYCVGKMQRKYDDVYLITSWGNLFNESLHKENINNMKAYLIPDRTIMMDMLSQQEIVKYIGETDIGFFPNRCEGGTNLVMMEYMACGKPVIANNNTGQKDVLNNEYAFLADSKDDNQLIDECLNYLEKAYEQRNSLNEMGKKARETMKSFTWEKTAREFLKLYED